MATEDEAQHPDNFLNHQLDLAPSVVCAAAKHQPESVEKPPMSVEEFLASLERQGLAQTISRLIAPESGRVGCSVRRGSGSESWIGRVLERDERLERNGSIRGKDRGRSQGTLRGGQPRRGRSVSMDTITLVENQIDDGQRLLDRLGEESFAIRAAGWVKPVDEDRWSLYIVTSEIDVRLSLIHI